MPNYKGRRPGTRRIVLSHKGKPKEWVITGTKADGDKFEAEKRLELRQSSSLDQPQGVTFSELSKTYARHAESHLKASTWRKVRIYQIATLVQYFGTVRVDQFTMAHIDAYKRARLDGGTAPGTVNFELTVLQAVFSWARAAGHFIPELKWKRLPVRKNDRVKFWTSEQLALILSTCRVEAPDLLPMLVFLANTGCRKGESVAADWSWVDFDASLVRITPNDSWQPKSGKARDVPLSDALRATLSGPRKHKTIVFPNRDDARHVRFPTETFDRVLKVANLTGNPHMFRHTFASHFLMAIPDLQLLGKILGHTTTRVTEIYAHMLPGRLDRARNAVNIGVRLETVEPAKQA